LLSQFVGATSTDTDCQRMRTNSDDNRNDLYDSEAFKYQQHPSWEL